MGKSDREQVTCEKCAWYDPAADGDYGYCESREQWVQDNGYCPSWIRRGEKGGEEQ